jgi:hypothetical protein
VCPLHLIGSLVGKLPAPVLIPTFTPKGKLFCKIDKAARNAIVDRVVRICSAWTRKGKSLDRKR